MLAPDVNVLVDAYREDSPYHGVVGPWLRSTLAKPEPVAVFELVLSGFLRVVTHPRVFAPPAPLEGALSFVDALLDHPRCVVLRPGPGHWEIFVHLAREADARGNLLPDAYLASMVIESGCTLVTSDRDFARFSTLRWQTPGES